MGPILTHCHGDTKEFLMKSDWCGDGWGAVGKGLLPKKARNSPITYLVLLRKYAQVITTILFSS